MNNSGNITLFRNDNSTVKKPTVTIQEIGSTTGWGSTMRKYTNRSNNFGRWFI